MPPPVEVLTSVLTPLLELHARGEVKKALTAVQSNGKLTSAKFTSAMFTLGIRVPPSSAALVFDAFRSGKEFLSVADVLRRLDTSIPTPSPAMSTLPSLPTESGSTLSHDQYEQLMRKAVWADKSGKPPTPAVQSGLITRPVVQQVKVPVVEDVRVPVSKWTTQTSYEDRTVQTKTLKPVTRHKQIEETVVEVQEAQERRTRMVWKLVPEEYYETVKKPVTLSRTREVPYTDFEECVEEKVVQVPVETKVQQHGYRIDQRLGSRLVELERDEVYEVRPHWKAYGDVRIRYDKAAPEWFGTSVVGREVFGDAPVEPKEKDYAFVHGYATSLAAQKGLFAKMDKDKNGTIDFNEVQRPPKPRTTATAAQPSALRTF